ncbi:hypothetical protein GCM10018793_60740 [Streptomyces sulfonofaciens]|uniref:Uncharacterized protein n=1 Tax=Streptomyces sulfonofaciens TaxID=68272 RepID=A0A919L7N8_9ACTN|nr:hypothetical protein GCM10018793_60740 [Streptomyces sulfonofaciens]
MPAVADLGNPPEPGTASRPPVPSAPRGGTAEPAAGPGRPGACGWCAAAGSRTRSRSGAGADIVITATPATVPVLRAARVREGTHMTAIGTDIPHKNELPPALFARATLIATDDHQQCLDHGDFARAVRRPPGRIPCVPAARTPAVSRRRAADLRRCRTSRR